MPEKATKLLWVLRPNPIVHWWFKILMMGVLLGILIVWGTDGLNMNSIHKDFLLAIKPNASRDILLQTHKDFNFDNLSVQSHLDIPHKIDLNFTSQSLAETHEILEPDVTVESLNLTQNQPSVSTLIPQVSVNSTKEQTPSVPRIVPWVSANFEPNYSSYLLAKWLTPGGEQCKDSRTVDIRILPSLDENNNIELSTAEIHQFIIQTLDDSGKPRCFGGDYFEIDLSSQKWKARPPIQDMGNGTYKFSLQVHPDFAGDFNLTVILLFRSFQGLKFSPARFAFDKVLRVIPIRFFKSESQLLEIQQCKKSDYSKDIWSGRWTRHAQNDSCPIRNDGRYICQEPNFPCQHPWCNGPLGVIESNGWIYSTHCSFKLFSRKEAWKGLNNRWIFWWGDSNHCDTLRNILNFILDVPDITTVPRIFDMNITNPRNKAQKVRFTSIFNGHPNSTGNYQGLNSLINVEYQESLKGYFSKDIVPDTIIMNSGLHDGIYWSSIRNFIKGADYAASFWSEVIEGVRKRGLIPPEIIYRTTIATGGYARQLAFNPQKMEAFNGVVLDKLRKYGVVNRVIDDFDMTYPWHYDNRCNDGVHYGRAPLKMRWRDGEIGHQYFVDLMLGHVLVNALCVR